MRIKILCLAIAALVVGCSKETTKSEMTVPALKKAKMVAQLDRPDNPENPADSIGIIHNQALAYVYKKLRMKKDFSNDLKRNTSWNFLRIVMVETL